MDIIALLRHIVDEALLDGRDGLPEAVDALNDLHALGAPLLTNLKPRTCKTAL